MQINNLPEIDIVEYPVFVDIRGEFSRILDTENKKLQVNPIKQVSYSMNELAGTFRGLHMLDESCNEIKIVRCISGSIMDYIVDLRPNSVNFKNWMQINLTAEAGNSVVIPPGFAHGFQTLENNSIVIYAMTANYDSSKEMGFKFNDPQIDLEMHLPITSVSEKDLSWEPLTKN